MIQLRATRMISPMEMSPPSHYIIRLRILESLQTFCDTPTKTPIDPPRTMIWHPFKSYHLNPISSPASTVTVGSDTNWNKYPRSPYDPTRVLYNTRAREAVPVSIVRATPSIAIIAHRLLKKTHNPILIQR